MGLPSAEREGDSFRASDGSVRYLKPLLFCGVYVCVYVWANVRTQYN